MAGLTRSTRHAPTASQPISISIATALRTLIFENPEIKILCEQAEATSNKTGFPFCTLRNFGLTDFALADCGWLLVVNGHDDHLIRFLEHSRVEVEEEATSDSEPDDELEKYFEWPPSITAAYDAVDAGFTLLFSILGNQELVAWGTSADGHQVAILETIWTHSDFFLHPVTGDLWESSEFGKLTKMYSGVVLRSPLVATPAKTLTGAPPPWAHPTPADLTIHEARAKLYSDGVPPGLQVQQQYAEIQKYLEDKGLPGGSNTSLKRYFRKLNKSLALTGPFLALIGR